jgi:uncharacterized protein YkwD
MTTGMSAAERTRWEALTRTAAAVRAADDQPLREPRSWRRIATTAAYLVVLTGVTIAALHAAGTATPVRADGSADSDLFSLTNQDRSSNGVRSMSYNGTLGSIGEGARYNGCGFPVNGRSDDMIQRNYFAHPILNCGQLVFSIMQAFGVHYLSAGENIGWNTVGGAASAASSINSAFMASPDHRANILNGNYTDLGIGSDNSGSNKWTGGGGGGYTGVWMFSEEFAQLRSSRPPPPPPPPPTPKPKPRPRPTGVVSTRNSAAPAAPEQPPVTAPPAPAATLVPTPVPAPTATPGPTPLPILTLPPLVAAPGGLLFNSVESVLESYLID